MCVLIVEDNQKSAKVIEAKLRKGGYETIIASSGKQALRYLLEKKIQAYFTRRDDARDQWNRTFYKNKGLRKSGKSPIDYVHKPHTGTNCCFKIKWRYNKPQQP